MNRRNFLKKGTVFTAGLCSLPGIFSRGKPAFGAGISNNGLNEITVSGSGRQRGRMHGAALKEDIAGNIRIFKNGLSRIPGAEPDDLIKTFLKETNFAAAVRKWTPDLLDEVKGIAEGARQNFNTVFAMQMLDEFMWYPIYKRNNLIGEYPDKCSCLGLAPQNGNPSLVAQNQDFDISRKRALIRITDSPNGAESFVFTLAGVVSVCGMNSRRIGLCVNSLLDLNARMDGLPVAFVNRGILAQDSFENAVEFVTKIDHASGQNYVIGGPDSVVQFECSGGKKVRYYPLKDHRRIFHTNHALANNDSDVYASIMKKRTGKDTVGPHPDSVARMKSLQSRLSDFSRDIGVEEIKDILRFKDDPWSPVCKPWATMGSLIYELKKSPLLHLANGSPDKTEYREYAF